MNTERHRRLLPVWVVLGLSAGALLTGCGILDTEDPTTARLVLGGAAGHPLELVVSDDFNIILSEDGETRSVQIVTADTTSVSPPFDERYDLGSRARFYAKLSSESVPPTLVSMKVFVGGDAQFSRQTDFDDEYLEFTFTVR